MNYQFQLKSLLTASLLSMGAMCFGLTCSKGYAMSPTSETQTTNYQTSSKIMTRCVGRFLLDVPDNYASSRFGGGKIGDYSIDEKPNVSENSFEYIVKSKEAEFKALDPKIRDPKDRPYLKSVKTLPSPLKGVVFNHISTIVRPDLFRHIEAYLFMDNHLVTINFDAMDVSSAKYDDKRITKPNIYKTNLPERLQLLHSIMPRLSIWSNDKIPNTQGSCFSNIFVKGPADIPEDTILAFISNDSPNFLINYVTGISSKDTMLERHNGNDTLPGVTLYKQGVVKLSQYPNAYAEERLVKDKYGKYVFTLNVNERSGTHKNPYISINFTGFDKDISAQDAIKLWDQVIQTLRPRPNAF